MAKEPLSEDEEPVVEAVPPSDFQEQEQAISDDELIEQLRTQLKEYRIWAFLENKMNLNAAYLFPLSLISLCFLILLTHGLLTLCEIVAFLYPAYKSAKMLKSDDPEQHVFWLSYWIVYGVLDVFMGVTDRVIFWVPHYEFIKVLIWFWCFLPMTQGSKILYNQLIHPSLSYYQEHIDQGLDKAQEHALQAGTEIRSVTSTVLANSISTVAMNVANGTFANQLEPAQSEAKAQAQGEMPSAPAPPAPTVPQVSAELTAEAFANAAAMAQDDPKTIWSSLGTLSTLLDAVAQMNKGHEKKD